jgi:ABC-type bacteriocin/lantibiotic exporter with double-glycine peptidase domain
MTDPAGFAPIPLVLQRSETDCGAACLAMVLAWHGQVLPLDRIRAAVGETERGTDAAALLRAARLLGLGGRGFLLHRPSVVGDLPRASILHWRPNHYVVLDVAARGGAFILDPARGPRQVTPGDLERDFTGVALVFEPAAGCRGS